MKRAVFVFSLFLVAAFLGCGAKHPRSIEVDPEFNPNNVGRILVAPVLSSIPEGLDPYRRSEVLTADILWKHLSARNDYVFISPREFRLALIKEGKTEEDFKKFKEDWTDDHKADVEILRLLDKNLDMDLVLIPEVYLWHKDEADYRETSTASATQVGATISLVNPLSGKVLWEATDENYQEAVRTEGDRVMGGSVIYDRRIRGVTQTGKDMYAAPPFDEVALKVIGSLVGAIPTHSLNR